jgi:orotate phosphoribosyltransferase
LSNYSSLIDIALEKKIISDDEVTLLKSWRENPSEWGK